MFAHAERYDIYLHEQASLNNAPLMVNSGIDFDRLSSSFAEGQSIRKAWDARKTRKQHEKAMQELISLNLKDNNVVVNFAKKYPYKIDKLREIFLIQNQLTN
ncbi:hypothetical protein [Psychrobacter sp. BF1]|uniref:hypothetical protein n=1 Tax=Psychrobacter sp. BF1 TaxID=2821147 RepID=UPI001C4E1B8D|nr:hypothetical protein [Psychrobacter sp. BF1]